MEPFEAKTDLMVPEEGDDQDEEEVECVMDDKPQRVVNGLFIGSAWAEMNKAALEKAGITDILQVAQGLFPRYPMCFTYMVLQVEDHPSTDLVCLFPKCFEFIDRAISKGGSVLVHCAAGVSRSATIVLGYLMSRHCMSLTAALDHLKAVRPWVCPNPGFIQQLEAYQVANCDLSSWQPWHLVWKEQQQQQQQKDQQLVIQPLQQQQQQQWLQLPQPCDGPGGVNRGNTSSAEKHKSTQAGVPAAATAAAQQHQQHRQVPASAGSPAGSISAGSSQTQARLGV